MPRNPDKPRPKPEDFDREEIVRLRSEGLSIAQVGAVLKCSDRFLQSHFSVALKEGDEKRYTNMRVQAETLASIGLSQEEIAAAIGVDADTVRAHAGVELTKKGMSRLGGSLKRKMYEMAMNGDRVMMIWFTKNQIGWRDNVDHHHSGGLSIEEVRDQVERRKKEVTKNEGLADPELSGIVERVAEDVAIDTKET